MVLLRCMTVVLQIPMYSSATIVNYLIRVKRFTSFQSPVDYFCLGKTGKQTEYMYMYIVQRGKMVHNNLVFTVIFDFFCTGITRVEKYYKCFSLPAKCFISCLWLNRTSKVLTMSHHFLITSFNFHTSSGLMPSPFTIFQNYITHELWHIFGTWNISCSLVFALQIECYTSGGCVSQRHVCLPN